MSEIFMDWSKDGRYRVRLVEDTGCPSPREDSDTTLAHVITHEHSHYHNIDEDGGPLQRGWDYFKVRSEKLFLRWVRIYHGAVVVVHRPPSGPYSIWYLTQDDLAEHEVTDPEAFIRAEIAEYQAWADGDVYCCVVERAVQWGRRDGKPGSMTTWEHVDSCFGLIGYEYAKREAKEALESSTSSEEKCP